MKKRAFLLLPLAALLLTGCPKAEAQSSDPWEDEEEGEVIPPFDPAIYGTESAPLSVAKLIQNVKANVKAESGKFSYHKFTAIGYVSENAPYIPSYSQWDNFYIVDNADGTGTGFKVQRAKSPGLSLGDTICKKDRVLITGYTEYFNGGYSFFPKDDDADEILSCTRGEGLFTISKLKEDITYTETFQSKYTNMTPLTLHATTTKANYAVVVKNNGALLTPEEDGSYAFKVKGDTAITLDLEYVGPVSPIPHEEDPYTLRITDQNSSLGTASSSTPTTVKFGLVEDDPEHDTFYEKVEATFTNVHNHPTASYHEITFEKAGKVTFKLPASTYKFTKVEVCTYQYTNIGVYKDETTRTTSVVAKTSESIDVPGYQNPHLLTYEIPAADQGQYVTINATDGKSISIHYIQLTMSI